MDIDIRETNRAICAMLGLDMDGLLSAKLILEAKTLPTIETVRYINIKECVARRTQKYEMRLLVSADAIPETNAHGTVDVTGVLDKYRRNGHE
jgi:hypothetical protein